MLYDSYKTPEAYQAGGQRGFLVPVRAWLKISCSKAAASRALGRDPALAHLRCEAGESPRLHIPLQVISRGDISHLRAPHEHLYLHYNTPPSPHVLMVTGRGTPIVSKPSSLMGTSKSTHFSKPGCLVCPPQLSAHTPRPLPQPTSLP